MTDPVDSTNRPTRPRRLSSKRVVWLAKLLIFGVSSLIGLLGIEIGLRLIGRGPLSSAVVLSTPAEPHADPRLANAQRSGWIPYATSSEKLTPFPDHPTGEIEFRRNSAGLRGLREVSLEPTVGTERWLVLGDSHAEGMVPENESMAVLLAELVNSGEEPTKVEVLNGAFRRASPFQAWWAFDQAYRHFQPQRLIVVFFAGNDLVDLLRTGDRIHLVRDADGWKYAEPSTATNATEAQGSWSETIKQPLRKYSAIYRNLTEIRWLRESVVSTTGSEYRQRLEQAAMKEPGWVWQAANQLVYFREHPGDETLAWEQLRYVWSQFKQAESAELQVTLLVLPTATQVHPQAWPETQHEVESALALDANDWSDFERVCDQAVALGNALGLETIDLREPLRAAAAADPEVRFYYPHDQHLNAAGNTLVAELLAERWRAVPE